MITKERKQEVIAQFASTSENTGETKVQIALLTERITQIAAHIKSFPKDKHSQLGLLKLVGQRNRLARYLKRTNPTQYDAVMAKIKSISAS